MTRYSPQIIAAEVRAEIARQKRPTQRELGELLRLSQAQVCARIRGDVEWRISELALVADVLGVPIAQFLPTPTAERAA